MESTICAVSTTVGTGAISIIRCSGPEAINIVNSVFKGSNLEKVHTHTINYGHIIDKNEIIDEVLVNIMKAPKTFTKEDVVEINAHGGIATTNKILDLLLTKGCVLAEPGEFTKRAFLNGRIDLLEAEAVSDLITSETEKARKLAINQISGKLSDKIKEIRSLLIAAQANIEVNIDYPEYDDVEVITNEKIKPVLLDIQKELNQLLIDSESGKIIKDGIDVAIIGKPNVGKSSILNNLLEENKAIVTDIPGTTRDAIEGKIILSGIMLNMIDTAGIRNTEDIVEKIGVEKSLELSKNADLIIYVLDNSLSNFDDDLKFLEKQKNKKIIVFINKDDINKENDYKLFEKYNLIKGNTVNKEGLDSLKNKIIELFNLEEIETKDYSYLSNARQISLVRLSLEVIENALENLNGIPIDMITVDLKTSYDLLGEIIGETYKEDLLDELFSKFCLGK